MFTLKLLSMGRRLTLPALYFNFEINQKSVRLAERIFSFIYADKHNIIMPQAHIILPKGKHHLAVAIIIHPQGDLGFHLFAEKQRRGL